MTKVVAIVNQKGGVGKTTTAVNLASGLALSERKSLLLDLDPQSNSTRGLGYGADPERASIYDVLLGSEPLHGILLPTEIEKLSLAPSEPDLIGFEVELMGTEKREWRLRDALIGHDSFDLVLVDCPPSLGLLTVNALVAADGVRSRLDGGCPWKSIWRWKRSLSSSRHCDGLGPTGTRYSRFSESS